MNLVGACISVVVMCSVPTQSPCDFFIAEDVSPPVARASVFIPGCTLLCFVR